MNIKDYDVLIIGGGPGGATAAMYCARGGLSVALVHNAASALHLAERVENYYGVGATDGAALYEFGLEQAARFGATIIRDQAVSVEWSEAGFDVTCTAGAYRAARLVIATGAARARVDIPGMAELVGKGVSFCAVCDAFFYRKKTVGVIGAGEFAEHEYSTLAAVANAILLTDGEHQSFSAREIDTRKIAAVIEKNGRVGGVRFADGAELALDGLFIAKGVMSSSAIAKRMGVITDRAGAITVDARGMTNVAGLYAAGDCTPGIKQVGKAVADGVNVGMSILADFKGRGVK